MSAPTLSKVAATLTALNLRPVIDRDLDLVRADCPACRAQENDPLGLHRPVEVVPLRGTVTYWCSACGRREVRRHVV